MKNEDELWTIKQVKGPTGFSDRTIWRLNDEGKMPEPIRINHSVRWRRSDIMLWIELGCPNRKKFEKLKALKKDAI